MKNLLSILVLSVILNSCASTNKIANESIRNAIIGQNEMIVCKRMGMPSRIVPASDGGKIMIYEYYSKGMYLTPNKSAVTYNANRDLTGDREGFVLTLGKNIAANDSKFTIYPTNVSYLKVYIDSQGNAVRYEQNLPQEQLDIYHERFKHFNIKDK